MKLSYTITRVSPQIFAVVVPAKYDRAMLFCRAQEFYESTSHRFRGRKFSIWNYMRWYAGRSKRGFSYGADWSGFNIPIDVIADCYAQLGAPETPYDSVMLNILAEIRKECPTGGYLIACRSTRGEIFKHELCHAKFYTNSKYRAAMTSAVKALEPALLNLIRSNLRGMGYAASVIVDEVQAYLQYGYNNRSVFSGTKRAERHRLNREFLKLAKRASV